MLRKHPRALCLAVIAMIATHAAFAQTQPNDVKRAVVQATVDGAGNVVATRLKKSSGSQEADAKALKSVGQGHFKPHLVNGVGVGGQVLIPVEIHEKAPLIKA